MSDEFLSQEELDALLQGLTGDSSSSSVDEKVSSLMSAIVEGSTTVLNTMIGQNVEIVEEESKEVKVDDLVDQLPSDLVVSTVKITLNDSEVDLLVLMEEKLGAILSDFMVGGTGENPTPLDEIKLNALNEVVSQMMGSATTTISKDFSVTTNMEPPNTRVMKLEEEREDFKGLIQSGDSVAFGSYTIKLDGKEAGKFFLITPTKLEGLERESEASTPVPQASSQESSQPAPSALSEPTKSQEKPVRARPVEFEEFQSSGNVTTQGDMGKLDLLLDVPLTISVELGRTKMTLKQVLEISNGSIIELDKLTGEPVDVLVNGKVVARGEVVVVDESFAVRITEIVSPQERLTKLK